MGQAHTEAGYKALRSSYSAPHYFLCKACCGSPSWAKERSWRHAIDTRDPWTHDIHIWCLRLRHLLPVMWIWTGSAMQYLILHIVQSRHPQSNCSSRSIQRGNQPNILESRNANQTGDHWWRLKQKSNRPDDGEIVKPLAYFKCKSLFDCRGYHWPADERSGYVAISPVIPVVVVHKRLLSESEFNPHRSIWKKEWNIASIPTTIPKILWT